jgi:hypothetical protein
MELQVKLGNIQAGIDSGHSVPAHSCKCELALVGRSINGSSLGHRHERLWLPAHLVIDQCQKATSSSAPLSCRLQAAGQPHLPSPSVPDKVRWKFRYKKAGLREGVNQKRTGRTRKRDGLACRAKVTCLAEVRRRRKRRRISALRASHSEFRIGNGLFS